MVEYLQTLDNGDIQVINPDNKMVYTLDPKEWREISQLPPEKQLYQVQRAADEKQKLTDMPGGTQTANVVPAPNVSTVTAPVVNAEPGAGTAGDPTAAVPGQAAGNTDRPGGGGPNNPRESK